MAEDMTSEQQLSYSSPTYPKTIWGRTVASYERELTRHRLTESLLRAALAREEVLLGQKDELLRQQDVLSKESDHRLLNGLQMIASLLSLQSRESLNAEIAAQLAIAANRVATIGRVHRRLHSFDGVPAVAFKHYLEDLCSDFSAMLPSQQRAEQVIVVEGSEINLPTAVGIPLGFIVNELITNAAKYGEGLITVRLAPDPEKGYALSVSNDGPALPVRLDPAACKGLGMKIVQSLVARIGGELRIGRAEKNQGAQFTVFFSSRSQIHADRARQNLDSTSGIRTNQNFPKMHLKAIGDQ
jgi:two-component system, sensor histidine kinase PdtaS